MVKHYLLNIAMGVVGDSNSTAILPCLEVVPCVCVLPPNIAINTPSNATSSWKMALIRHCKAPKNSKMTDISPIRTRKIAELKIYNFVFYLRSKKCISGISHSRYIYHTDKASLLYVTVYVIVQKKSEMTDIS